MLRREERVEWNIDLHTDDFVNQDVVYDCGLRMTTHAQLQVLTKLQCYVSAVGGCGLQGGPIFYYEDFCSELRSIYSA